MLITLIVLAWLGLAFGSFVSALAWRVHEQSKKRKKKNISIITGRSQCPNCGHILSASDLVPVLSWLYFKGKCRHCGKSISWQYPAVELALAVVFTASYLLWPGEVNTAGDWVLFITWLATAVGLMALMVYDARWMILPNRILYPTLFAAAIGRLAYIIGFEDYKFRSVLVWAGTIAVASGIFWILFLISRGKWIGFGDVRLGLITGSILSTPADGFLMIILAAFLGTVYALPGLIKGGRSISSRIPFGPFLIGATWLVLLFGSNVIDWYKNALIP